MEGWVTAFDQSGAELTVSLEDNERDSVHHESVSKEKTYI